MKPFSMMKIKKRYVVKAVQLDLETFQKIERLLEGYALEQSIKAVEDEPSLDQKTAQKRMHV